MALVPELLVRAYQHQCAGRLGEAERLYRQVLSLDARQADALHLLGLLEYQRGRHREAQSLVKKALARNGANAQYHNSLATIWLALGKRDRAVESLRRALALDPGYADAHYNLATILQDRGAQEEAEAGYRKAIALKPDLALAHNNLALSLRAQGRGAEAIAGFRQAIAVAPALAVAHYNLGIALEDDLGEAIACFRRAIALAPNEAEFHNNLGNALMRQGALAEAAAGFRAALALKPDFAVAHSNLLMALTYDGATSREALRAAHAEWAAAHGAPNAPRGLRFANDPSPGRRLRVGYVSPDFRAHVTAIFAEPLLAAHDRAQVEIVCYADVARPDATTKRFEALADLWVDSRKIGDDALAERVRRDGIDILVDLAGHTAGNRLGLFARKPAPVQATWLGYPGTTGLATIDYRITDGIADPADEPPGLHSETLFRLPRVFLCYQPLPDAPPVAPVPALAAGRVTFGSFNNLSKITPDMVASWSRLLAAVPESRLLLKARDTGDPATAARYRALFAACGMTPERVDMIAWSASTREHLALYGAVDVALDTAPYNGTTTTCEAMWMGVPVVSLRGDRHAGRVGASLLTAISCPEFVAETPDAYLEIAAALARDRARLSALRTSLRGRMKESPLCDAPGFARAMEAAYREMWQRWCTGAASSEPAARLEHDPI